MRSVLGINAYHGDSSACLVVNGELIAAAEEERFRRVKHWAGFPSKAIAYCLSEAGLRIADVEHVAINSDPGQNFWRKAGYALKNQAHPKFVFDRLKNIKKRTSLRAEFAKAFPLENLDGKVHYVEHHLCHLASCYFASPFEEAMAVSVDGFGDFASAAWGLGKGSSLRLDDRVFFPHSLGIFYQAMTQHLGFPNYGDEYKIMGLAPYGVPRHLDKMRQIVKLDSNGKFELSLKFFRHHQKGVDYKWEGGLPIVGRLYSDLLIDLLGPARAKDEKIETHHCDIARSVQDMYEEAVFNLLNSLHERYKSDCLTLAGGCAMNSVANGKVYRRTPFKRVYVQPAAGDAGGAIGAAFIVSQREYDGTSHYRMEHAYWGPHFDDGYIGKLVEQRRNELTAQNCKVETIAEEGELCVRTAHAVSQGKVVGWFQDRMEWGPRALGNRSIVCDPRRADMKDILNAKIKRREAFRPFAPSILREYVTDWFEEDDEVPFMMKVFQIKEEQRALIPAVTHVDGSGRLQTVTKHENRKYYGLIEAFHNITGVPMILNTSFNENEPIVCRPEEALDCFLRTHMDVLVLQKYFICRYN